MHRVMRAANTAQAVQRGVMPLHARLKVATGRQLWEEGFLPPLHSMRHHFLDLPPNVPLLGWVDEHKMEHQFAMFTQTAVGKMLLQHAPHHCTVHFPFTLPFEHLHAKAKVEDEYPTLDKDIEMYKQREVQWKDMVWNLWQLSHVHEMAHRDPQALPIHISPLSFRETVCSRETYDLLHQVEESVQAQLLHLPRDKELTHEKAVHGKTSNHLSDKKLQRGILAEKDAAKDLWLYPEIGTENCPASAEFIIDRSVINVSATTDPRRHWEKCLTELFSYAALARHQGLKVDEVGLCYPFLRHVVHIPIADWDHRALFDRVLNSTDIGVSVHSPLEFHNAIDTDRVSH